MARKKASRSHRKNELFRHHSKRSVVLRYHRLMEEKLSFEKKVTTIPAERQSHPTWDEEVGRLSEVMRKVKPSLVVVGDSIARNLRTCSPGPWSSNFPRAVNLGIGGDRTQHVLHRVAPG